MKLLLITTTIKGDDSLDKVSRLRNTLSQVGCVHFKHLFLLQNSDKVDGAYASLFSESDVLLATDEIVSLSRARNIMIDYFFDKMREEEFDYIAFPDDDAWYSSGVIEYLVDVSENYDVRKIDLILTKYGEDTEPYNCKLTSNATANDVVMNASSNTIFISQRVFLQLNKFDENLGVGSRFNGGEDLDYAIRCYNKAEQSLICDLILVGHRNKNNSISSKYYLGSYISIANALKFGFFDFVFIWVRKLLIGFYYIVKLRVGFYHFLKANFYAFFVK